MRDGRTGDAGEGSARLKRPQEGGDGARRGGVQRRRVAGIFEPQQAAQMDFAARQCGELLGGQPRIRDGERAGLGGPAQKRLDLHPLPLRRGGPEDLPEHRKAGDLADDDAVERDRLGRQHEVEIPARDRAQRGFDIDRVERLDRKAAKTPLAEPRDDRAEELLLAGEVGVDGGLRDASRAILSIVTAPKPLARKARSAAARIVSALPPASPATRRGTRIGCIPVNRVSSADTIWRRFFVQSKLD